ncbi:Zinc finger, GRF-type [Sesbania bispinosa]|nr:Zinc finger, GRF-type [Sesbania bispinosa]
MEDSTSSASSGMVSSTLNDTIQFCICGVQCKVKVSRTGKNPGRRFLGCGNYDGVSSHCDFFCWYDPPTPKHCTKVVSDMLRKNEDLLAELKAHKEQILVLEQKLEIEKTAIK